MYYSDGFYMYIETSNPRKNGDKARLVSKQVNVQKSGACLKFWYHMWGSQINTLNVFVRKGKTLGKAVWTKKGSQGNKWILGQLDIPSNTGINVSTQHLISVI